MPVEAQWFGVIIPNIRDSFVVLVIGGRIAAGSDVVPIGSPWSKKRASWEAQGWKVAPLPEVPVDG